MVLISNIVGLFAVAIFLLGYLQKTRRNIILCNGTSRVLYVIQYFLLSAFSGAVMDLLGIGATFIAQKKNSPFFKKHLLLFVIPLYIAIIGTGLALYENIFSLLPIIGVVLQTSAFFLEKERIIRIVSLLGCPCWLVYDIVNQAYGSMLGDCLGMISLIWSLLYYDILPSRKKQAVTPSSTEQKNN